MQKTLSLCLTLLWVGLSSLMAQTGNELVVKVDKLETAATAKLSEDKYKEAEDLLNDAIQLMPLRASLYHNRAFARLARKNIEGMFDDLYKAVRLDPENPEYYYWRGYFLSQAGNEEAGIKDFTKGLDFTEKGGTLYNSFLSSRCGTYIKIRKLEEAIVDAKAVLALDSNNVVMLNNMGVIMTDLDRAEESLPYFIKAFELAPERSELIGNIGWGYLCAERYDESLIWYNREVETNPNSGFGYSNRGYLKIQMGDLKGAKRDLKKAIKYDVSNSFAYKNRALLYIEMEDYEQACEELNLAEQYGFTKQYGSEVKELKEKYCQ